MIFHLNALVQRQNSQIFLVYIPKVLNNRAEGYSAAASGLA